MRLGVPVGLSQRADEHRPKDLVPSQSSRSSWEVLSWGSPSRSRSGRLDRSQEHQDVEQLGAGSGTERVQGFTEAALAFGKNRHAES